MDKATRLFAAVLLLLAVAVRLRSQETFSSGWTFPVVSYRLNNGLRVVFSEDQTLPVVSVVVAYGAGSVREQRGQTGLAYFLENLMFQGSENVGPLQHLSFIQKVGGELNANTTPDKTLFYETVPSSQLPLALWLESDRMRSLLITAGTLERVRSELLDNHRRRMATEPYLESYDLFDGVLYPDFAYGHPLVGNGEDLKSLSPETVRDFYERYYVPANAVLAVVGSFDLARARELVSRYFDSIPPGTAAPTPALPRFEQDREVVRTFKDPLLPTPGFHLGYRLSPLQTGDRYALGILDYLLLRGQSSRLSMRIMKKDLTAYYLTGGLEERLGLETFKISALNNNEVMADRCQKAVLAEFDRLKVSLVTEAELDKSKHLYKMDYLRRLSTTLDRALFLTGSAFADVTVSELAAELERHMRVSPQNIYSLAVRLFVPANLVVVNVRNR
ncbi:MAG TPA: pitrilysin family protein [Terriglobales bacterium]|nr:pitrilysin family protein [Terriglobales bacterium]